MIFYILFCLGCVTLSVPFLPPNTVHTATSEIQINLIINENRNYFILIGTVQDAEEKKLEKIIDYFNSTVQEQSGICLAIAVDCSNFKNNMEKETEGVCKYPNSLSVLAPSGKIMNLFDHLVLSMHDRIPIVGETSQGVLVKKIRDRIPDLVKQIEDDYDLQEYLDVKGTKIIFFEQNLLKPPFLKKLALVFYRRIDFAVCDNKNILQKYEVKFGSILILNYDHQHEIYLQQIYKGDTNFENNPFEPIKTHLEKYVFQTRSRDILLDFQINQNSAINITSRLMLNKLMYMDKIVVLQKDKTLECAKLNKFINKDEFMFTFVCYNDTHQDMEEGKLYYSEIRSIKIHELKIKDKLEDSISFPELPNLVSNELQMDKCLKNGQMMNKLIAISYISDPHSNYLLRFVNAHPGFSSIFHFCKVYVPDRFTFKKVQVKEETLSILIKRQEPHPSGGEAYDKVQHKDISSYYNLKMFLREISIRKLLPVVESIGKNITQVHTPEQLTANCFQQSCIIGLIRPKKSRSKAQISLLTALSQEYKSLNFIWINSQCHFEIAKELKLDLENSQLIYFNQKQNKYASFGNKYWIKSEVRKWLKSYLSGQRKLKKLKYSVNIQPKRCEKNIYLEEL